MTPGSRPIKLVIVDDSELVRMGLKTLLSPEPNICIAGEAGTVAQAIVIILNQRPDVVLMDIRMPDGTGFDACRKVLQQAPETRIIFLTSVVDDHLVDEAIRSGGNGYLLKEINGRGLIQAVNDVAAGKSILDPTVTNRVMNLIKVGPSGGSPLDLRVSPQERRVLALVADGKTNKEIAADLGLSEKTVKNYLANIFSKLNLTSRTQAALYYTRDPELK